MELRVIAIEVSEHRALLCRVLEFDDNLPCPGARFSISTRLGGDDTEERRLVRTGREKLFPVQFALAYAALPIHADSSVSQFFNDQAHGVAIGKKSLRIGKLVAGLIHRQHPAQFLPCGGA